MHVVNGSSNINSTFQSEISDLNQLDSDLTREEGNIKGELQWLESRGKKRKTQVDIWLNKLQDLKKRTVDMNNSVDQFGLTDLYGLERKQLTEEVRKHKEQKPMVLSNEFVGESFEENVKKMWELLGNDQVFIIGIHGMGGVGKTLLATHTENEIKRKGTFKDVFWVTVSRDFSILKLQHDIAKRIGIKLYGDDERSRATELSSTMTRREKSVLILDDVWKYIDLQKVGIPVGVNGIKLILTSRLKHLCQQMDCLRNNMIQMLPLLWGEAWDLFLLKLGHHGTPATLPPEILETARSFARTCDGLPLGISVMARTMKGVNSIHQWEHALNKLEKGEMGEEVEEEVVKVLKRSYDNLTEKDMRKCFLYCALLCDIDRTQVIMKLVDSGLINGMRSLKAIFDEGHTILDKVEAHSLWSDWSLQMNGVVRNMACHTLKESYMVKCNKGLRKIPHVQEWTADLEAVSLMDKIIEEIPEGTSPYCPRLSTLLLNRNFISRIPECFFTSMNALAVLDLSSNWTLTSLPNSLGNLRSLISLVLRRCYSLKHVPPLGELQALCRLVITESLIERVPEGLENLINLKWLDLSCNDKLTLVPGCVLHCLTNMQCLDLRSHSGSNIITAKDVHGMSMVECFGSCFRDCQNYNNFVGQISDTGFRLKAYRLYAGRTFDSTDFNDSIVPDNGCKVVYFQNCEEFTHLLPIDLVQLRISSNHEWICLCNALSSHQPSSLRNIEIVYCTELKSLFCLSGFCSSCTMIPNLESLHLDDLESLTVICREDELSPTRSGVFSHLTHFYISECHKVETLVTAGVVPQLQNLETITVENCNSMKEIFAVSNSDDDGSSITLPKLTRLELTDLPELKTVCKGIILCKSSPTRVIKNCPIL